MNRRDPVWLAYAFAERRCGLKGPRAAEALKQLGLNVPARANSWAPLRTGDRDGSPNVIGRLGSTEFFIEESGAAPGIAALEELRVEYAYPLLREDFGLVLGGARADEVLAQVCNVNFAALTQVKPIVMTLMIGVGVLVLPQLSDDDGPVYRIWCDPSFGTYLWKELEEIVQKIPTGRA
jgi:sarcosine oxidase, subunit gamma